MFRANYGDKILEIFTLEATQKQPKCLTVRFAIAVQIGWVRVLPNRSAPYDVSFNTAAPHGTTPHSMIINAKRRYRTAPLDCPNESHDDTVGSLRSSTLLPWGYDAAVFTCFYLTNYTAPHHTIYKSKRRTAVRCYTVKFLEHNKCFSLRVVTSSFRFIRCLLACGYWRWSERLFDGKTRHHHHNRQNHRHYYTQLCRSNTDFRVFIHAKDLCVMLPTPETVQINHT